MFIHPNDHVHRARYRPYSDLRIHVPRIDQTSSNADEDQSHLPNVQNPNPASLGSSQSWLSQTFHKLQDWTGLSRIAQEAQEDMDCPPSPLSPEINPFVEMFEGVVSHPEEVKKTLTEPQYQKDCLQLGTIRAGLTSKTLLSPEFQRASQAERIGMLIGHLGVGPGKLCQIMASRDDLDPEVQKILSTVKSKGAATRTLPEAQQLIDRIYGSDQYQLQKLAGVGTIGEAYLANRLTDRKPVVIKLLKDGITPSTLKAEWRLARVITELSCKNPAQLPHRLNNIDNLYRQWSQELDFTQEAEWARLLGENARNFKVVKILALGSLPNQSAAISMVQERAEGVSLDQLTRLIQDYKTDSAGFASKYSDLIAAHPWLAEPDTWMKQLPGLYREAYNEQSLVRVGSGNRWISHGDPHAGNVFINFNPQTRKLEATFIDTGLTIVRDAKTVANHVGVAINTILGNSDSLARAIVKTANVPPGPQQESTIQALKEILDQKLFKARVNLTDQNYNNRLMDKLIEKFQLDLPPEETAFFKAQMQALMNYNELSQLVDQPENNYLKDSLADIAWGASKILWHEPVETSRHLLPAGQHLYREGSNALRCMYQFFLPAQRKHN
jgi:predicted unusual protein kinase regulating ubiquinone biosynthesis (AarF/ABC1/UbiB family)